MGSRGDIGAFFLQAREEQGDRRHEKSHVTGNGMESDVGRVRVEKAMDGYRSKMLTATDPRGEARKGRVGLPRARIPNTAFIPRVSALLISPIYVYLITSVKYDLFYRYKYGLLLTIILDEFNLFFKIFFLSYFV